MPGRLLLAGVSLLALASIAPVSLATTLEEAVQNAVLHNPDIGAVSADRRAADEQISQARATYFPQADTRITIGREWANTPSTRAASISAEDDSTRKSRTDAQFTLRQMLFDGFLTPSETERRKQLSESAASQVMTTAELTAIDAIEAYLEVRRFTDIAAINRDSVRTHEAYVSALQRRVQVGAGDVGELRRAQSRLALAVGQVQDAEGRLKDAISRYIRTVGEPPVDLKPANPPAEVLPASETAAIELTLTHNPRVQRAMSDVEAARAQSRGAKAGFYPQFDFEVNGFTGDNLRGIKGRDSTANALLVLRYNLSRGGADLARSQEAIERLSGAHERLSSARQDAQRDMRLAMSALDTARKRLQSAIEQVAADARGRDAFRRQFDVGRSRILDLLDSERDYYNSLATQVTQEATANLGVYRVLQSGGVLLRTLNIQPPNEAFGRDDAPWEGEIAAARTGPPAPAPGQAPAQPGVPADPTPGLAPPLSPESPGIIPSQPGLGRPGQLRGPQQPPQYPPSQYPPPEAQSPAASAQPYLRDLVPRQPATNLPPLGDTAGDQTGPQPGPQPGQSRNAPPPLSQPRAGSAAPLYNPTRAWPDLLTAPPLGDGSRRDPQWPSNVRAPLIDNGTDGNLPNLAPAQPALPPLGDLPFSRANTAALPRGPEKKQ